MKSFLATILVFLAYGLMLVAWILVGIAEWVER